MWTHLETWNFLMRRFMGEVNVCFSFWTWLNRVLTNQTPKKLANIWKTDRGEINAMEFDRTQTHFCWRSCFHCHRCWTEWSPFLFSLNIVQLQHAMIQCSTFVEIQLQHLLINYFWSVCSPRASSSLRGYRVKSRASTREERKRTSCRSGLLFVALNDKLVRRLNPVLLT